jgi:hypothetical protein
MKSNNEEFGVMSWKREFDRRVKSRAVGWIVLGVGTLYLVGSGKWELEGVHRILAIAGGIFVLCVWVYDTGWRWKVVIDRGSKRAVVEWGLYAYLFRRSYDLSLYNRVAMYKRISTGGEWDSEHGPSARHYSAVRYKVLIEGDGEPIRLRIFFGARNRAEALMRPERVAEFLGFEHVRHTKGKLFTSSRKN